MITQFLRIRQTWYPIDSIDQIDDVSGKMTIALATGHKIVLDPIEAEKVVRQLEPQAAQRDPSEPTTGAMLSRMVSLEAQLAALKAHLATLMAAQAAAAPATPKAKAKTNA